MRKWMSGILVFSMFIAVFVASPVKVSAQSDDRVFEFLPGVAVYSTDSIRMSGNSIIKGSAAINTYDISIENKNNKKSRIDGNLMIKPGADVSFNTSTVTGEILPLDSPKSFSVPEFSNAPLSLESKNTLLVYSRVTIKEDAAYESIRGNDILTVDVGDDKRIIRVKDIDDFTGSVKIIGSGSLHLFIDNVFHFSGNDFFNSQTDSDKVHILVQGEGTVAFSGQYVLKGNIYAPNADIKISGGAKVVGNILAGGDTVELGGNASIGETAIYAPNAKVKLHGNGDVFSGAVICKDLDMSGNGTIQYKQVDFRIPGYFFKSNEPFMHRPLIKGITIRYNEDGSYKIILTHTLDSNGIAVDYDVFVDGVVIADAVKTINGQDDGIIEFTTSQKQFKVSVKPKDGQGNYGIASDSVPVDIENHSIVFQTKPVSDFVNSDVYIVGDVITYNINLESNADMKNVVLLMELNSGENRSEVFYVPNKWLGASGGAAYMNIVNSDTDISYEVDMAENLSEDNILSSRFILHDNEDASKLSAGVYDFVFSVQTGVISAPGKILKLDNVVKIKFDIHSDEGVTYPITFAKDIVVKVYSSVPEAR